MNRLETCTADNIRRAEERALVDDRRPVRHLNGTDNTSDADSLDDREMVQQVDDFLTLVV